MKKIKLLLLALLAGGTAAYAQFFEDGYGLPASNEVLESGVNTFPGPSSHVLTGYTDVAAPWNAVTVVRDGPKGNAGGGINFNRYFKIFQLNTQVSAQGRRVIIDPAGNILVWGDFTATPGGVSTDYFLMSLTPAGVLNYVMDYSFAAPPAQVEATSMTLSPTNGTIYVSGWVMNAGVRHPVIMNLVPGTGAMIWSFEYSIAGSPAIDWTATDLVESPYTPDVAIVGHMFPAGSAGPEFGIFYGVNTGGGAPTIAVQLFSMPPFNAGLDAIAVAANPFGSGPGFVMAGYSFGPPGSRDFWIMKTNPVATAVDFSNTYDYSTPGLDNYATDVIERLNTMGTYEYYVGGAVLGGFFGGLDGVVLKLDFAGNPMPPFNEFTYGGPGNDDVMQLDQDNSGLPSDGLSAFGNTNSPGFTTGANDLFEVKAYFSGHTACNFNLNNAPPMPGPFPQNVMQFVPVNSLNQSSLSAFSNPMGQTNCLVGSISAGSNARIAQPEADNVLQQDLSPNPVSRDNANVKLKLDGSAGTLEIELYNPLGQNVWKKQQDVGDGQQELGIALGDELDAGIYMLVVKHNNKVSTYKVSVQ